MRLRAEIFLLSTLLSCSVVFGQRDYIYDSLEEALLVHPDSVYRLDLSQKKLREIPVEIFQFKNLQNLNLEKNKLSSLPKEFIFPQLEILNLSKNDFEKFPEVVTENITLKQLLMGKNKIDSIPESISNLQNLIVFDIWFNPITDLPASIVELKKLRSLDLRGVNFSNDFQKKW